MSAWSVLDSEEIHRNPWFGLRRQRVRAPGDRLLTYFSVDFPRPAVGIVPVQGDQILLLRQYRLLIDAMVWAIPSGGVEPGESVTAAAARELEEETGWRAGRLRPLLRYHPSYGATNQVFETFVADDLHHRPDRALDPVEVLETRWFPRAEVSRMIRAGELCDGLSLVPLLLLLGE